MDLDDNQQDICRVCRSEATIDKPLFYPCVCTGSIKYIHQDCLVQWLKFSKKEFCELCNHKFSFIPIYSDDMPKRLPLKDLVYGLVGNLITAVKYWFHYSIVAVAWLFLVPFLSYRVIKCLFDGSFYSIISLPIDILAYDKLIVEEIYGAFSVMITCLTVICVIWLRETIVRELPQWLANDNQQAQQQAQPHQNQDNQLENNQQPNDANNQRIANELDEEIDESANNIVDREDNELQVAQDQEDVNEWENMGRNDEISFERIFGLDHSFLFLEHVFWVISLNGLFVLLFVFCPYHLGLFTLSKFFDLFEEAKEENNKIEKVFICFIGYLIIGITLVILHYLLFKFNKARRLLGIGYLIVKVGVVTVLEIGIIPILCGSLLDIFSLPLFNATLQEREAYFKESPGLSAFLHWVIGFSFIFYITSLILILKDYLKPSLVSFISTLSNPDFSPVQEIIHLSVFHIVRRYIIYLIAFVSVTFIMVFLPIKATEILFPNFLPYNLFPNTFDSKTPDNELPIDVWKLHIITPLLYDFSHLRTCSKSVIEFLCFFFAYLLDLKSYLLNQETDENEEDEDEPDNADSSNEQDENSSSNEDENDNLVSNESNAKQLPNYLYLRLFALLLLVFFTMFLFGFSLITVPACIGRTVIGLFVVDKVNEFYTVGCGLYVIILNVKIINLLIKWVPRGVNEIYLKLKEGTLLFLKTATVALLLCGFLPSAIGLLFEVVIFVPLRVPTNQTPIYYLIQDWLLGILLIKVIVLLALFNDWNLRETLEEFYQAGFVNIDLKKIVTKFIMPVFFAVGLVLSIPYVLVYGLLAYLNYENLSVILRKMYLSTSCLFAIAYILNWQYNKFCKLYEHIKNERYLIGTRLCNYSGNDSHKKSESSNRRPFLALGI